jgi:hypothetical protein
VRISDTTFTPTIHELDDIKIVYEIGKGLEK